MEDEVDELFEAEFAVVGHEFVEFVEIDFEIPQNFPDKFTLCTPYQYSQEYYRDNFP